MFVPRQVTLPRSGRSRPLTTRSKVVLPLPFGPETCSNSPACDLQAHALQHMPIAAPYVDFLDAQTGSAVHGAARVAKSNS